MTDKEEIEILKKWIKDNREFEKEFNLEEIVDGTQGKKRIDAIENILNRLKELEKIEKAHCELNGELRKELQLKDKIVMDIVKRLDNDIKNITETKADGYTDDYRRCRLKAYRTKR